MPLLLQQQQQAQQQLHYHTQLQTKKTPLSATTIGLNQLISNSSTNSNWQQVAQYTISYNAPDETTVLSPYDKKMNEYNLLWQQVSERSGGGLWKRAKLTRSFRSAQLVQMQRAVAHLPPQQQNTLQSQMQNMMARMHAISLEVMNLNGNGGVLSSPIPRPVQEQNTTTNSYQKKEKKPKTIKVNEDNVENILFLQSLTCSSGNCGPPAVKFEAGKEGKEGKEGETPEKVEKEVSDGTDGYRRLHLLLS